MIIYSYLLQMNLRRFGLSLIIVLVIACNKSSQQNSADIKGNWVVTSRVTKIGSALGSGSRDFTTVQYYHPGSDSLSVNLNNNQFAFFYLSGGNSGFINFSDTTPALQQLHLNQDQGSFQVIGDSELVVQPNTSASLKYCNSVEYDSQVVTVIDTLNYKTYGTDSMILSQNFITPSQIINRTTVGFRKIN